MALARIISHSHEHCRELAMDLLARGYAVEIVSPDKIPDNFADLELRVDADMANLLTAKVVARNGEHSSFFDFAHHLDARMGDFVRRPPRPEFESVATVAPVNVNAKPNFAAEVGMPVRDLGPKIKMAQATETSRVVEGPKLDAPRAVELSKSEAVAAVPAVNLLPDVYDGPPVSLPTDEVAGKKTRPRPKRGITVIVHHRPKPKIMKTAAQSSGWFLRVSAGFALVVALSAIPIVGIRGGDPLVPTAAAGSEKIVPAEADTQNAPTLHAAIADTVKDPEPHNRTQEPSPPQLLSKDQPSKAAEGSEDSIGKIKDLAPEPALVYRERPAAKARLRARRERVRRHPQDDTVARDTVTYLNR